VVPLQVSAFTGVEISRDIGSASFVMNIQQEPQLSSLPADTEAKKAAATFRELLSLVMPDGSALLRGQ
jgi:hypothetical protein